MRAMGATTHLDRVEKTSSATRATSGENTRPKAKASPQKGFPKVMPLSVIKVAASASGFGNCAGHRNDRANARTSPATEHSSSSNADHLTIGRNGYVTG